MFVEQILRGEDGVERRKKGGGVKLSKEEMARRVRAAAAATVAEEERLKRAKPMSAEQEELRALLACVPPFDLLRASNRNSKSAAAAQAAFIAADVAIAAAATNASGRLNNGDSPSSMEASLNALASCRDACMRSLQLDAIAPGLRVDITGRLKSAYSTHLKMARKKIPFGAVCDARALRVVIGEPGPAPGTKDEVEACFVLLEAIHKLYRPVPGEYDDYVTNVKASGYQSLHTAVTGPDGALLEVQVRTRAMHDAAEFGDAAHWIYKDSSVNDQAAAETTRRREETFEPASASVGQPVQIVHAGDEQGARLGAGVVCYAEGSRVHVVEPTRGDTLAPSSATVQSIAEWIFMGLHKRLLKRALESGRVEPNQLLAGSRYTVTEFAFCSDQRWHKVDAYGRKTATTAELLDEEARKSALERAWAEAEAEEEAATTTTTTTTTMTTATSAVAPVAFESRDSAYANAVSSSAETLIGVASTDDAQAARRTRDLNSLMQGFLEGDATFSFDGGDGAEDEDEVSSDATSTPVAVEMKSRDDATLTLPTSDQALKQAREELEANAERAAAEAAAARRRARRAQEEAAWRSGKADSPLFSIVQAQVEPSVNDKSKTPHGIFDQEEAAQLERDVGEKMRLASTEGKNRAGDGEASPTANVALNDEKVMVITWSRNEDGGGGMTPELLQVRKGVTAAQLMSELDPSAAATLEEGEDGAALVNVNEEMISADTPLNDRDMLFIDTPKPTAEVDEDEEDD
jgi:hypothetical protein